MSFNNGRGGRFSVLFLGAEGAGKTCLVRSLQIRYGQSHPTLSNALASNVFDAAQSLLEVRVLHTPVPA